MIDQVVHFFATALGLISIIAVGIYFIFQPSNS